MSPRELGLPKVGENLGFDLIRLHQAVNEMLILSAILPDENLALRARIQANVKLLVEVVADDDERRAFLGAYEQFNDLANIDDSLENLAQTIDELLKNLLGARWMPEADIELMRLAQYIRDGEVAHSEVIDARCFYFEPPEEIYAKDDVFPSDGRILPSELLYDPEVAIGKNLSIFNPLGIKIFWGDLSHADIAELKGTYYILNQEKSYLDVPGYAVIVDATQPSVDPKRPNGAITEILPSEKPMLEPDYIRANALGAIVNGKIAYNPPRQR